MLFFFISDVNRKNVPRIAIHYNQIIWLLWIIEVTLKDFQHRNWTFTEGFFSWHLVIVGVTITSMPAYVELFGRSGSL